MSNTYNWLTHDHSLYEELLVQCQDAAAIDDWAAAKSAFKELVSHLKNHMAMEEEVLYPAYEEEVKGDCGPTQALRDEHDQIVRLVQDMVQVFGSRDSEHVLECLNHLEAQMIKHHEKEEDIFLPMAALILNARKDELTRQLNAFDTSKAKRKWEV